MARDGHGELLVRRALRGLPGDGGEDRGGPVGVRRVVQPQRDRVPADLLLQLGGRARGDHPPPVDHGDGVGQRVGLLQVLGGEQGGDAVGGQPADRLPQLVAPSRVEPDGRLVEEHHLGPPDEARGQVQPPAHAPGPARDRPAGRVLQAEPGEQLTRAPHGVAARQVEQLADHDEVGEPGQLLVDAGVLAGEGDPTADLAGVAHHVEPRDPRGAGVRAQQRGEDPDQGGLAGAVGAEQAVHPSAGDGEPDAVERRGRPVPLGQGVRLQPEVTHGRLHSDDDNI
ncbi:hypothetical protein BJF78_23060 [Pseudonocardia sp. CNS-139]|nr:hypothetical protein BJF78_23060 [Pseudonocardia sp. CNS-139]